MKVTFPCSQCIDRRPGWARRALGCASALLLVITLVVIWALTEQTPEETSALTNAFAFKVDDALSRGGDVGSALGEVPSGAGGFAQGQGSDRGGAGSPDAPDPAIASQPVPCEVREGGQVAFSVDAPGALAYRWECTDAWTDGWYSISGVDMTGPELRFELTHDRVWMRDCRFRCKVAFPDGEVLMSDEVSFVYRDVIAAGGWYRNAAHVVEFGFVGLFASASAVLLLGRRAGERTLIGSTPAFCAVSSLTDQVHKLFVPGREFELVDLLLDAIGYVGAITLVFAASRIACASWAARAWKTQLRGSV